MLHMGPGEKVQVMSVRILQLIVIVYRMSAQYCLRIVFRASIDPRFPWRGRQPKIQHESHETASITPRTAGLVAKTNVLDHESLK